MREKVNSILEKIELLKKGDDKVFESISNSILQLNKDLDSVVSFVNNRDESLKKINNFNHVSKLQVGGGPRLLEGYLNMDIFEPADIVWDVRTGIPFEDNRFDEIFCEHFFEHMDFPKSANFFLNESFRVLKKGGVLKIVVPDCGMPIEKYVEKDKKYFKKIVDLCYGKRLSTMNINSEIDVINYLFRDQFDNPNYTVHWWGYDKKNLSKMLKNAGFSFVKDWKFDTIICNPKREFYSLYLIAKK